MDSAQLGLRVGLEIHQQLSTRRKLFCSCPLAKSDELPLEIQRKLRAVVGELGAVDRAAQYEFLRNRSFVYRANSESSCLVEKDEDPPKRISEEALRIALQACRLLGCDVVDELYVMRKTVVDGSAVSGFQRTALIGMNGAIETSHGSMRISSVCLEEDSAPPVKKQGDVVEYRLDRLGTPLIEIATGADMHTPAQVRETAEKLGLLLRSLNVVRGIGSIRQDVNVSIKGGARVEIKGFQELERIEKLVENEAARQLALLGIQKELQRRGVRTVSAVPTDVTDSFRKTKNTLFRSLLAEGRIIAFALPQFSGLAELMCGGHSFGRELSHYAAAHGCGITHSDENSAPEFQELRKQLRASPRDLLVIVAGKNPEAAAAAVIDRAAYCLKGVPEETRVAHGIDSVYTRPLPGADRIYPETDVPPVRVTPEFLSAELPKTLIEEEAALEKILPKEMAKQLVTSRYFPWFSDFRKTFSLDAVFLATTLLSTMKEVRRKGFDTGKLGKDEIGSLLRLVEKGMIPKKAMQDAMILLIEGRSIAEVQERFSTLDEQELHTIVARIVKAHKGKSDAALMGIVMAEVKGRADGRVVARILAGAR